MILDAQGMAEGASEPGVKGETERVDNFQILFYLQGSHSRKMASIHTLKPQNVSILSLF